MEGRYYKEYSSRLNRDMEYKVYGDRGKLCLVFAPQNGRFFDFENFGMVDLLMDYITGGRLQLVEVDSIDQETWSNEQGDPRQRLELQEKWFSYVTDELLPTLRKRNPYPGKALATGCSMGGTHASLFFFRRPDLFDTLISLSATYNVDLFFHGYMDDLAYANSPAHFLRNMPADHPYMDLYRKSKIICCVGRGAWEDELLASTKEIDWVLRSKNIPAWVDFWGYDVSHDWCWWKKQLTYFMEKVDI